MDFCLLSRIRFCFYAILACVGQPRLLLVTAQGCRNFHCPWQSVGSRSGQTITNRKLHSRTGLSHKGQEKFAQLDHSHSVDPAQIAANVCAVCPHLPFAQFSIHPTPLLKHTSGTAIDTTVSRMQGSFAGLQRPTSGKDAGLCFNLASCSARAMAPRKIASSAGLQSHCRHPPLLSAKPFLVSS